MNWELVALFSAVTLINVVGQTVKSIVTIKCGKWAASIVNALAYGVYTIAIVYTVCDLNLWLKVAIVAAANFLGVLIVKIIEEKARKDKLWKIEATVRECNVETLSQLLHDNELSYSTTQVNGANGKSYRLFNIFCKTHQETDAAISSLKAVQARFFVGESKI